METDCGDGLDDDGDGEADCLDVDCVGLAGCPSAVMQVRGGHGTLRRKRVQRTESATGWDQQTHTCLWLSMDAVSGVVAERTTAGGAAVPVP